MAYASENQMNGNWNRTLAIVGSVAVIGAAAAIFVRSKRNRARDAEDANPYGHDLVDLYIEESFPASDSPAYAPTTRVGGLR
ncbi:MAG: hypothetical protein H7Y17_01325 [Chlorobia bacterium]|nr:hypothetical protein [Fimbriimonadaceae bacterium]